MKAEALSPTIDFAPNVQGVSALAASTVRPTDASLAFFMLARFDFATGQTLGAFLDGVRSGRDDERFRQSAVKSLPRGWRDL